MTKTSASFFKREVEVKRNGLCVLVGFLAFAFAGATAWAQATTAQINGTVKDPSGAVLPGVEVTVTQTATGAKRSTVSNETGNYVLASLPLGPYMLQAELPGFKAYVQTGIVLQVDANPTINVVLQIGQVSEQVEVQADAGLVETRTTAIGQVVTNQQVADALELSVKTAETYRVRLTRKLGVKSRAELFRYAFEVGMIGPDQLVGE